MRRYLKKQVRRCSSALELEVAFWCEAGGEHHRVDVAVVIPGFAAAGSWLGPEGLDLLREWPILKQVVDEGGRLAVRLDNVRAPL